MHKIDYQPIPVNKEFYNSKLSMTNQQTEKYLLVSENVREYKKCLMVRFVINYIMHL